MQGETQGAAVATPGCELDCEYPCLGGDCTSKREGKQQLWCPKSTIPYYLLFYSLESCRERRGRNSFLLTLQQLFNMTSSFSGPRTRSRRAWNLANPEEEKIATLPSCFSSNKQRLGLDAALGHFSFIQQGQVAPEAGPGCCPGPARIGKKKEFVQISASTPHD